MSIEETPPHGIGDGIWRAMHLREQPRDGSFLMWWLGQSGFAIRFHDEMAVVDPYLSDSLTKKYEKTANPHVRMKPNFIEPEWLANALVTVVSASHQHTDHLDPETLKPMAEAFARNGACIPLLVPRCWRDVAAERAGNQGVNLIDIDAGEDISVGRFLYTAIPSAHEALERDESGRYKYLGYVIRFGKWTLYHSGDTLAYDGLASKLRPFKVDVAILPINGKVGNMGGREAAWLAKEIGAKVVIPCHYDMFEFNTADPYEEFVPECEKLGQKYRVLRLGERWSSEELGEKR